MDPSGKVALVTGAGRRVGRALALALGDSGCRVVVHYHGSKQDAQETASLIESLGTNMIMLRADLEDPEQVDSLASDVAEQFGPIEILVNNASVFEKIRLGELSVNDWNRHFAVNVHAPLLLAQKMREQLGEDSPGKIINLNDSRTARRSHFAYGVSKTALSGLTRSLALELAPRIQVNEILLGAILPPAHIPLDRPRDDIEIDLGPADRMGTLNEVTNAMMMLISNDFITGESINVDGGRHIN